MPKASDLHPTAKPTIALAMLPLRVVTYTCAMVMTYPTLLVVSILRAVYKRVICGKVSDILKFGGRMWPNDVPYDVPAFKYPATFSFNKPLNPERLKDIFLKMAEEAKVPSDKLLFWLETEPPAGEFHHSGSKDADHYLPQKGTNILKEMSADTDFAKALKPMVLGIRIWNGEPGKPTLMHAYLAGGTWDGTSCFNFCKEMLSRYHGNTPIDFFKGTSLLLKLEAKEILDRETSFVGFVCRQPYCLFINLSCAVWQLVSSFCWAGGAGLSPEVTYLNFDEVDSAKLAAGAKAKGMKPFAAFTYAAVKAYREVLGEDPHSIMQQSSIQTRHYAPQMDRTLTGDWLIGPLQYIGKRKYGYLESQEGYENLLKDLDGLRRPALRSLESKAWGIAAGGASLFEAFPSYNDDVRLMASIFFNNYGIRSIEKDTGVHHYNWQAPFKMGFNTICVNDKTSIGIASSFCGLRKLEEIRDSIYKTFKDEFMSPSS